MNIEPLGDRVIIKPSLAKDKSGSIILPEVFRKKPQEGVVVAVGKGQLLGDGSILPMTVKVGDTVLFGHAYAEVTIEENEKLFILREADLLAIVVEE